MGHPLKFTVGLEIHVRLNSRRKIFCPCVNTSEGPPNAHNCPVCLGLPGSLPVLNPEVPPLGLALALALDCDIPAFSEFGRKNYFYPDLPRNYQITQWEHPLARGGSLDGVALERIHLEEDAGRSRHGGDGLARVDFNRAGAPLAEIVTLPEIADGKGARRCLGRLRQLVRYLGISDGDMEKGSLRCDANVGLAPGHPQAGPWVEVKNLNSLRFLAQAVDEEIDRLARRLREGRPLIHETRGWDPRRKRTYLQRQKEGSADYLHFPEPDLPLLTVSEAGLEAIRARLPERPWEQERRFQETWGLDGDDARTLSRTPQLAGYFRATVEALAQKGHGTKRAAPEAARWILGPVLAAVEGRDEDLAELPLKPASLAALLDPLLAEGVGRPLILRVWPEVLEGKNPAELLRRVAGETTTAKELAALVQAVLTEHPRQAQRYRAGQGNLLNFFMGQVLGRANGAADPVEIRQMLVSALDDENDDPENENEKHP